MVTEGFGVNLRASRLRESCQVLNCRRVNRGIGIGEKTSICTERFHSLIGLNGSIFSTAAFST